MKNGGKRQGAGRPKGAITERTQTLLEVKDRIAKNVDTLINAQLSEAKGTHLIYRLNPIVKQYVLVTDKDEIKTVLDTYKGADVEDGGLYIITTKKPDVKAGQYLLDRAYGKPPQSIDITNETDPRLVSIKYAIQAKAEEKGISYEKELKNYLEHYALPDIKEKLVSELEN